MPIFFRPSGPKIRGGVQKSKKRSFFGIKNVKNFESGNQKKIYHNKLFNPPMRPKRHFALKDTFPMETIVNKKTRKNFQNFAKLFFEKKNRKQKKIGNNLYFFFSAPAAPLFFFNRKTKILRKTEKKIEKKFQVGRLRGDPT